MNAQQVCNRFWRPATKTTFGSYTECWNILCGSGYALPCSLNAVGEMHQSQVEFCLWVEF